MTVAKIHFRRGGFKYGYRNGKFDAVCGRVIYKSGLEEAPTSLEQLRPMLLSKYCIRCCEVQWIYIQEHPYE